MLHLPLFYLSDIWSDIVKQLQDSKTWDFLINVAYAAAIGIGGFVVRKFGLKIRKNAAAIGEITSDVLAITKENEQLKTENSQLKTENSQLKTDYGQQQDSYRMIDRLFEISKGQLNEKIQLLETQLAEAQGRTALNDPTRHTLKLQGGPAETDSSSREEKSDHQ
jgi:regulator of replication initiation timing